MNKDFEKKVLYHYLLLSKELKKFVEFYLENIYHYCDFLELPKAKRIRFIRFIKNSRITLKGITEELRNSRAYVNKSISDKAYSKLLDLNQDIINELNVKVKDKYGNG